MVDSKGNHYKFDLGVKELTEPLVERRSREEKKRSVEVDFNQSNIKPMFSALKSTFGFIPTPSLIA